MNEIGTLLYTRRKELGLTLEEVGNAVGVGKSTVRKWENGMIRNIGNDKLAKLSDVLHINPVNLVPRDGESIMEYEQPYTPKTMEARSLAKGMDTMPEARRKAIMEFMISMAPDIFTEGNENNDDA